MKKLIAIMIMAITLLGVMGNVQAQNGPKSKMNIPMERLVISGIVPGEYFDVEGDVLVMYWRGLPSRTYILQATRDFVTWENVEVFRVRSAARPETLAVPTNEQYVFFRVKILRVPLRSFFR